MDTSKLEIYRGDRLQSIITFEHPLTIAQADAFTARYAASGFRTWWWPLRCSDLGADKEN